LPRLIIQHKAPRLPSAYKLNIAAAKASTVRAATDIGGGAKRQH
jgi:hypothetical protein